MSRTRYRIFETEYPYFMTCTLVGWLPVFSIPEAVDIVLESWRFLQVQRGLELFGFVIMENHLHWIARAPKLANAVKSFKMYTARNIIDMLENRATDHFLRQLSALKLFHKIESAYQVWQEGSEPKQIQSDDMMRQKLEYTHNNPVRRGYVDDPVHWRYSSARNYARRAGLLDVIIDWA
jgi:REP element-mobilizing transposase RayT